MKLIFLLFLIVYSIGFYFVLVSHSDDHQDKPIYVVLEGSFLFYKVIYSWKCKLKEQLHVVSEVLLLRLWWNYVRPF